MKKHLRLFPLMFLLAPGMLFGQPKTIRGFNLETVGKEFGLEVRFDQSLKAADLDGWMKKLSAHPHHLGSPYGKVNAEFIRDLFTQWGFNTRLEKYKVLFPVPVSRILEMTAPTKFSAKLTEPGIDEDATSRQSTEQLPVYNAWSADGDINGELVFVNYGIPEDYEALDRLGIDVKGKIVIAKYGGSWRGIKPKVAQERGATGCIIYSDPKEDGYYQGEVYPKGPFKNQNGAQRGSVIDLPLYPGDPLTPGTGATENAKRIDRKDASNLLKIPVIPISYSDALPLLTGLAGPVAPEKWRGALPITYHIGPGPVKVHLKVQFDWKMVDCYDVIATLKGSVVPDEWVIRGNHHDAWVNGAGDPISGLVAELEEAKALGDLVKGGWKPRRTIIYCAWDGEEQGLIGSTEWVEDHAVELRQKAVAYINTDGTGRGFLSAGGSHTLQTMVDEIVHEVTDPETNVSLFERKKSHDAINATVTKTRKEILERKSLHLSALGSGSDFSGFLQHLGVPTLDFGFSGEDAGGEYHSIYDSYDNYNRFKDPQFEYGITLAKTSGRAVLRLADATVLPFDFKPFQKTIEGYVTEIADALDNLWESTETENQMIHEKRFAQAADPLHPTVPPAPKDPVPYLNLANLHNALASLERSVETYSELSLTDTIPADINRLNQLLFQAEQKLIIPQGLPRRSWYKHVVYAPGFYTGYGVKTLPGIREAIEQRAWKEAQEQIDIVAGAINSYTDQVNEVNKILMLK
jgi:N-acetylated-alpha-linked acidic dipeptidase